jgi:branched-chain amino acid transport system ATP-binding protein
MTLLVVENVTVDYDGAIALREVSLSVDQGSIVALVGSNGAGKSTLLSTVVGLKRPARGRVLLDGRDITGLPAHRVARLGVALVPEGRRLFPGLSVWRNLLLGAYGRSDNGARAETLEVVRELFPVLEERRDQQAATLSGGEQQMLAIGRALMSRPRLLLLDEPSLGIAPQLVVRIFDSLREINEHGITILLVEQRLQQALRLASRGYVLQTGRVALEGPSTDLLASDEVRQAYLGL